MIGSELSVTSAGARPRIELVPSYVSSAAPECLELLRLVGMPLLPWQVRFLTQMLGETAEGTWAAPQVGLIVPRQNGKSYLLAARVLAGLFLVKEGLITYTAHRVDTALEVFNLVDRLARSSPEIKRRLKRTARAQGKECIETLDGCRFKIQARSRATGRGFAGDCLILDEALELRDQGPINALLPTLATRPNSQLIFASSAGDAGSVVLASVRERGQRGDSSRFCYVEYAADRDADPDDEAAWAAANPGFPELIGIAAIRSEREQMSIDGFRQERLGIWSHELSRTVIPGTVWSSTLAQPASEPEPGKLGLAFDVATDRSWASIVVAWKVGASTHLRVTHHDRGDGWLVEELSLLSARYGVPVTYDDAGPARDVGEVLRLAGVETENLGGRDFAASCARLLSGLTTGTVTHHPNPALDQAAANASSRTVGEGWAFARRSAAVPISPLTAGALAVWAADHERVLTPALEAPMIW